MPSEMARSRHQRETLLLDHGTMRVEQGNPQGDEPSLAIPSHNDAVLNPPDADTGANSRPHGPRWRVQDALA